MKIKNTLLLFIVLNVNLFAQVILPVFEQNPLSEIQKANSSALCKNNTNFYKPSFASLYNWNNTDTKIYYTYNSDWQLTYEQILFPSGSRHKVSYFYDESKITLKTIDTLKGTFWKSYKKYIYSYDNNGNNNLILSQVYSDSIWLDERKDIFTYTNQNQVYTHIIANWVDTTWVNINSYTYNYNNGGLLLSLTGEKWENDNWAPKSRNRYEYNMNNVVSTFYRDSYIGGIWNQEAQFRGSFDSVGNALNYIYYSYSPIYGSEERESYSYTYDTNNNCIKAYHSQTTYGVMHFALTTPASGIVRLYFNNQSEFIEYNSPKVSIQYVTFTNINENSYSPTKLTLSQNYPNPFNPTTTIKYSIPAASIVSLKIYDILGKEVADLVNEYKNSGTYEVEFNAANLSSGTYFYQLKSGNYTQTKKLLLLK